MRKINWIVWHTAADGRSSGVPGQAFDTTAKEIDSWHRQRGWSQIGYHYNIRIDGTIETGRPLRIAGAHVQGLNSDSIGICFSGHGDRFELTPKQLQAGLKLTRELMAEYSVPAQNVIGHREVNDLIARKIVAPRFRTTKSCPGRLVDMDKVRQRLVVDNSNCEKCVNCTCKNSNVLG